MNLANASPMTIVLHIFIVYWPNFEENERIFEVAMNGQAFYREKREEIEEEKEIGINMRMMPCLG